MTIHPDYAQSPKASRGDAVRISWGMVQIPVRIHILTDGGGSVPARSMFTEDGHAVGNRPYDKVTDETYTGPVVKKVAMGDVWVDLTDDEIAAHSTLQKGLAEIETFIPLSTLGTLYVTERHGAWQPDTMKVGKNKIVDPTAAKASALLRAAMAAQEVAALVLVPSKYGGKYVALLPDGTAVTLSYADQVRIVPDTAAEVEVSAKEMALATALIEGIGISEPVLVDSAGDLLRSYLEGKAKGEVPTTVVEAAAPPAVDLMAALASSLEAVAPKPAKKAAAKTAAARKAG